MLRLRSGAFLHSINSAFCTLLFAPYNNLTIAFLHASLFDDLADGVGDDLAGERIFNRDDIALDGCIDLGILEGEIAALCRAVDQLQTLAVAERLCADDMAVDEGNVFRIPRKVLALDGAVADYDVLRVPESVLCVERRIRDLDVLGILEGIFSVEREVIKLYIAAFKEKILARDLGFFHMYRAASPAEFGGDHGAFA